MTTIFEQYKVAKEIAEEAAGKVFTAFMELETIEEKFKLILEIGTDFLGEDGCYCPHVEVDGREVSMYDDMHVERHQTLHLESLLSDMLHDLNGTYLWEGEKVRAALLEVYVDAINQDVHSAAIVRDMLENGISAGTWDW